MGKCLRAFVAIILGSTVSACASMTTGSTKKISVNTAPIEGASCELKNANGKWTVAQTPAEVIVNRDNSDMTVTCSKDGRSGKTLVNYSPEVTALGNVVMIGGFVGAIIDAKTGAAFSYPDKVMVDLLPVETKSSAKTHTTDKPVESAGLKVEDGLPL